jgi:hypothetical protein
MSSIPSGGIAGIALTLLACTPAVPARSAASEATATPEMRWERLERGVDAEEAVRDVKRLQHAYSHYLSSGLWPDLADLFTDDVAAEFHAGESLVAVSGKVDLGKYFMGQADRQTSGLAAGQLDEHLLLQPIVTLAADGHTAQGTWHEIAMMGHFGRDASWAGGVYENEYRLDRGRWKISRLRFFQQYSGAYEDWGHRAPARWSIPYHFEARHVGVVIPEALLEQGASGSISSQTRRAARLRVRLQRLEDENEVRNLEHIYGYYLDRKRWDDVTDLFADRGALEIEPSGQYRGKPHIRRALDVLYGSGPLRHGELFDHINLATVVTVAADGREAAARTIQLGMLGLDGHYASWEIGIYENRFIKERGVWKIESIHYYPKLITDYDEGWARDAQPARSPSRELPPDRQPVAAYRTYPGSQTVGFHFSNPATGRRTRDPAEPVAAVRLLEAPLGDDKVGRTAEPASSDTELSRLERELDAEIGVDAVENLNSSYGYYIDESAWDDMADTFASSGSKEITGAGVYVGPDRIRKVLNLRGPRGGRTPSFFTIHQLTQPVIHISADGSSAHARLRLFQCGGSSDGSSGSWIGGIYENTAVRENGEWKFGAQELHHVYNASYRNGWARVSAGTRGKPLAGKSASARDLAGGGITQGLGGAASGPRIASDFPPDRPISARQYAFPDIVEPPFHYWNPVTGRLAGNSDQTPPETR